MESISERLYQNYQVRREVSQPADLAVLLLSKLLYAPTRTTPSIVGEIVQKIKSGQMQNLSGSKVADFCKWLYEDLLINKTIRGATFYPVHPILALSTNGENARVERFIGQLVEYFTPEERIRVIENLWDMESAPAIERISHDLVQWQLPEGKGDIQPADDAVFLGRSKADEALSPDGILSTLKEDLLYLVQGKSGVQDFTSHAGRLLAFAMSRYMLAKAGLSFELPIYSAPAADTHAGVKTLAHEIIETHRAQFEKNLAEQFTNLVEASLKESGYDGDPPDEEAAREFVKQVFRYNANVVPPGHYQDLIHQQGKFVSIAYHYYWVRGEARSRFLRQLHAGHLNMAKKAGYANSRSQYSQWHFYWLAPSLVETLLSVSQARLDKDRMMVIDLVNDWNHRYGITMMIDANWEAAYRQYFRGFGSPEALNEANRLRFIEILAERGRLHKHSDDFPWVILWD
jgi:hypothetical protein